jgi:imidazole glycerol-phosphate synthase subunit HisF
MFYGASPLIFERAKRLRNHVTHAEIILWSYLKNNQSRYRSRRQHPVETYIVDFYCVKLKLVIDADCLIHNSKEAKIADEEIQKNLEAEGIKVMRFTTNEMIKNIESVMGRINSFINASN